MVKVAMMSVLRVRDVMTRSVHTLPATMPIEEAAEQLASWHVSGAPVVAGKRLAGVVSKTDLYDTRRERDDDVTTTVFDVMTPLVYAVRESDPAVLAARLMVDEHIHRVIVLDEVGHIAGIVTSMDLLEAIAFGWTSRTGREGGRTDDPTVEYVDLRRLGE